MKTSIPRFVLSIASWIYVFGICALMLFKQIPADGIAVGSFIIFIIIASAASSSAKKIRKGNDIEVNMAGHKYTGDALRVIDGANGITYVFVDLSKPMDGETPAETIHRIVPDWPIKKKAK